jgi:hypothetical protein
MRLPTFSARLAFGIFDCDQGWAWSARRIVTEQNGLYRNWALGSAIQNEVIKPMVLEWPIGCAEPEQWSGSSNEANEGPLMSIVAMTAIPGSIRPTVTSSSGNGNGGNNSTRNKATGNAPRTPPTCAALCRSQEAIIQLTEDCRPQP